MVDETFKRADITLSVIMGFTTSIGGNTVNSKGDLVCCVNGWTFLGQRMGVNTDRIRFRANCLLATIIR